MGLFQCHIFSEKLDRNTSFYVALPESGEGEAKDRVERNYQVLYLLPGVQCDHTKWMRRIPIEWIAQGCQMAVVLPDAGSEVEEQEEFSRYVKKELPQIVRMYFGLD